MNSASGASKGLVLGIDASRCRSGGAIAHIQGLLGQGDPDAHGIREIHLWAPPELQAKVADRPWLRRHAPRALESGLFRQLAWQALSLEKEARREGCDILFTADASTLCRFKPMIVLSQDMLSYEPGAMRAFGWGVMRLRLWAILGVQNAAFRRAQGVIFLTRYAAEMIQKSCGRLGNVTLVSHGVGEAFRRPLRAGGALPEGRPLRCLYVSPIWAFKHQWVVVRAVAALRRRGHNLELILAGGGSEDAQRRLDAEIALSDPRHEFVRQLGPVPHDKLPALYGDADLFVFASSCENQPVTLIEAMAAGLPIASSDRGPMPEILRNGGVYFNPEDAGSIVAALEQLLGDGDLRERVAREAHALAEQYSWARCAAETLTFIASAARGKGGMRTR